MRQSVNLTINGRPISVPINTTVIQACENAGIEIPRFCFHHRLQVAGNCRMCLVEVEKSPKPQASCALPVMEGMAIMTDTPLVKKAREAVLEMLLKNHPLDCPICDQGGECDLQDEAFTFGRDRRRFYEQKRRTLDKNLGPLIKTVMTRCIHCTRCVRFADEIAGVRGLGTTSRGETTEIGTYIEKLFKREISGNVIDLCPVGALTSKPYAFTARPWELTTTNRVDVTDAMGRNIHVDSRGGEVVRIRPREKESINQEWLTDKARFSFDGLKEQRLMHPIMRNADNTLTQIRWEQAASVYHNLLTKFDMAEDFVGIRALKNRGGIGIAVGESTNMETSSKLNELSDSFNRSRNIQRSDIENRWPKAWRATDKKVEESNWKVNPDANTFVTFNERPLMKLRWWNNDDLSFSEGFRAIADADWIILVGTNPRTEARLLNTRLRAQVRAGLLKVSVVGPVIDLGFEYEHLGETLGDLEDLILQNNLRDLNHRQNPMVVLGTAPLYLQNGASTNRNCLNLIKQSHPSLKVNILHTGANTVHGLQNKARPITSEDNYIPGLYRLGFIFEAEGLPQDYTCCNNEIFVGASLSDAILQRSRIQLFLPRATHLEQEGSLMNMAETVQTIKPIISPTGDTLSTVDIVSWLQSERVNYFDVNSSSRVQNQDWAREFWAVNSKDNSHAKTPLYTPMPILEESRMLFRSHIMCAQSRTMALSSQNAQTFDLTSSNYGETRQWNA